MKKSKKFVAVVKAYADCNSMGFDENERNLDFKSSSYFNAGELIEVMSTAIEGGYNLYDKDVLKEVVETFNGARYKPAREGSPCIYVYPEKNSRVWLHKDFGGIADEVSLENDGSIRLWWD